MNAAVAAAAGTLVLGLTGLTSLINGHDLGIFNLVAALTNAAWLVGSMIIAVSLKRGGKVSAAVAAEVPITCVATIPLATIGGGVIAGAYYLAIGYRQRRDRAPTARRCTTRRRLAQSCQPTRRPAPDKRGPSDVVRPPSKGFVRVSSASRPNRALFCRQT